ncbi:MAG: hypothetical protein WBZ42_03175 [Halobacteriota archaeon]
MKGEQCKNLQELTRVVADNAIFPDSEMLGKRKAFAEHVEAFHNDSRIPLYTDYEGIVLMTAHQPNFFPYSGVVRKAVLMHAVAEHLRDSLNCPVVELFCFADQDFADERWFREAQLPSVRNRNGTLSLHLSIAETYNNKILRAVPKPENNEIEKIKNEIQRWATESRDSILKNSKHLGLEVPDVHLDTRSVFELIDRASERSMNAADFNAFFLAYLIEECGYKTAFARFSECQQVFRDEIAFMLENFDKYARLMTESQKKPAPMPHAPIWYHCPCDGKADVEVKRTSDRTLIARCRVCDTTSEFEGNLRSALQQMLPNVSLRAEAVLIAFSGIGITFYVGGKGGVEYLSRADKIAEALGVRFPVVSTWRPKDIYGGIGQLDAILELLRVRFQYNLLRNDEKCDAAILQRELDDILADIDGAVCALDNLKSAVANRKVDSFKEKIAFIVNMQNQLKTRFERNKIARDRSIVANTKKTLTLIPSIIDYAVNVGVQSTVAQWSNALEQNVHFDAVLPLNTNTSMDAMFETTKQLCVGDLFE